MKFVELSESGRFTRRELELHGRHCEMVAYLRNAYSFGLQLDEMLQDLADAYQVEGYAASMALIEATIYQCRAAGIPDSRVEEEVFARFEEWPTDADNLRVRGQKVGVAFISDQSLL